MLGYHVYQIWIIWIYVLTWWGAMRSTFADCPRYVMLDPKICRLNILFSSKLFDELYELPRCVSVRIPVNFTFFPPFVTIEPILVRTGAVVTSLNLFTRSIKTWSSIAVEVLSCGTLIHYPDDETSIKQTQMNVFVLCCGGDDGESYQIYRFVNQHVT